MKGILAKSLLLSAFLVSMAVAQTPPILDSANFFARALSLSYSNPLARDFNGGGARAKGMGNAFLGVSDDISAVSWNPAGLFRQENPYEQPVLGLGYKSFSADASFRDRMYIDVPWQQFKINDDIKGVDFMSLLVPVRVKGHMFVGSIAYSRLGDEIYNSGMGLDYAFPFDYEDWVAGINRPFHYSNQHEYRAMVNALNVGFGTRVYDKLSFGVAVNAYGGNAAQSTAEVATWDGWIIPGLDGSQRGIFTVRNHVVDTSIFSGVYFTLGLKYAANKLTAGLVVKTPHTLKETRDLVTTTEAFVNDVAMRDAITIHNDNYVVELDQPLILGAGAGYQLLPKLLLAADFEYRAFGGGVINQRDSLKLVPGGTNIEYFTQVDPHWNNAWTVRLGTEYLWTTGSPLFPVVPLRAGIGYIQIPEPNVVGGTYEIDAVTREFRLEPKTQQASMTRWSLGTGLRWEQINVDLAYERYSLDRKNNLLVRESSVDNSVFTMTFTGYF